MNTKTPIGGDPIILPDGRLMISCQCGHYGPAEGMHIDDESETIHYCPACGSAWDWCYEYEKGDQ